MDCPREPTAATSGDADISAIAAMLANPGRSRILMALGDGRALPASQLAKEAGVAASTVSSHLAKLLAARLLRVERSGAYRYYRLGGPHVSELLEVLSRISPPKVVRSLRDQVRGRALRSARTCYDHLAGRLAVEIMNGFLGRRLLSRLEVAVDSAGEPGAEVDIVYELTPDGLAFLHELGVQPRPRGRAVVRHCLDWSERRHHLSGAVGRRLLQRFFDLGWIERMPATRAVRVSELGRRGFQEHFGVDWRLASEHDDRVGSGARADSGQSECGDETPMLPGSRTALRPSGP